MNALPKPTNHAQSTVKTMDTDTPIASPAFFETLFAADSSLRAAFRGDPEEQGRKLITMLFRAIQKLDTPTTLIRVLETLGQRQNRRGLRSQGLTGEALMTALQDELGDRFTPSVERAWLNVCLLIADVMQHAAGSDEAESALFAPARAA